MAFAEGKGEGFGGGIDGVDAHFFGAQAQAVAFEQGFDGLLGQAEAVDQLFVHGVDFGLGFAGGEAFVEHEAFVDVGAVAFGQQGGAVQFDFGGHAERCVEVGHAAFFEVAHGLFEHFGVEGEADLHHFAALAFAEDFAGAADFEVLHGEGETGTQIVGGGDGIEPFFGIFGDVFGGEQISVGLVVAAADAAAQLVQLRQAEFVGAVDDDGVGVGDVDTGFDDGGTQQDVETLLQKVAHHLLELAFAQLAVCHADAGFGQQFGQSLVHVFDGFDFVVQEKYLAAALEFAQHGFADAGFAEGFDEGFDGEAAAGGGGDE